MPSVELGRPAPTRTVTQPAAAAPLAVELANLTKVYPPRRGAAEVAAVDNVNLQIPAGQVYGLLGPNGAGKSTTVRMLATLLEPTSGRIRVGGLDSRSHQREVRRLLGVALGGERSVYWKLTARHNLEYFAALHGYSRRRSRARIQEVLEQMDLAGRADDYIESFSTGMRQRLVIARALLHRPSVLLLDEPASGLDPRATQTIHAHVRQLRADGHTILLTTHDMLEAESLSDRLGIIDQGRLVAEGTAEELKQRMGAAQIVHARLAPVPPAALAALVAELRRVSEPTITPDEEVVSLTLLGNHDTDLVPRLTEAATRHHATILRVENEPVSLKDVFLALTGRRLSAEPDSR